jgi:hypothetical protein
MRRPVRGVGLAVGEPISVRVDRSRRPTAESQSSTQVYASQGTCPTGGVPASVEEERGKESQEWRDFHECTRVDRYSER